MRTMMVRALPSLIAAGTLSAAARTEDWTGPKDVAKAAHEFAFAGLQAHMSGSRPAEKANQASPRPAREDNR